MLYFYNSIVCVSVKKLPATCTHRLLLFNREVRQRNVLANYLYSTAEVIFVMLNDELTPVVSHQPPFSGGAHTSE